MLEVLKDPKTFFYIEIVGIAAYFLIDIAKCLIFKEEEYINHITSYVDNLCAPAIALLLASAIFFFTGYVINILQFISGIVIGILEFLLATESQKRETTVIFCKFCEAFTIVLLFMLTEILSGKMKRLEMNMGFVMASNAVMSAFVIYDMRTHGTSVFALVGVFLMFAFSLVLKQLVYASQTIAVFIVANNTKIACFFINAITAHAELLETKYYLYEYYKKHSIRLIIYTILQIGYLLVEYFCLKYVNLDVLMIAKTIAAQIILIYKKTIEK